MGHYFPSRAAFAQIAVCVSCGISASVARASITTYNLTPLSSGAETLIGSITTDGTSGTLASDDIDAWSLSIIEVGMTYTATGTEASLINGVLTANSSLLTLAPDSDFPATLDLLNHSFGIPASYSVSSSTSGNIIVSARVGGVDEGAAEFNDTFTGPVPFELVLLFPSLRRQLSSPDSRS